VFLFMVLMTALASWGFFGDHGDGDRSLGGDEGLIEELLMEFGYAMQECLVVVEGDELFRPDAVEATRALVRSLEELEGVTGVLNLDDVPRVGSLPVPLPVLPADGASTEEFREGRRRALEHPLIAGQLASRDGELWVLAVDFDDQHYFDRMSAGESTDPVSELRSVVDAAQLPADVSVRLTGTVALAHDSNEIFSREQVLYHSIAYGLVFLLAAFLFRGFWAVIISGGGPVAGVIWTFGLLTLSGIELNSLTLILLPVLVMMIGFTDSVHLTIHIRRARSEGLSPLEATWSSVRLLWSPCFLTTLTTGLGFASLTFARSEMVRNFGFACAVGVVCTFLGVMTFLPFFASSRPGRFLVEREDASIVEGALPFTGRALAWLLRNARLVTVVGVILTGVTLVQGLALETEGRVAADIPGSSDSAQALRSLDAHLGGTVPLRLLVHWEEEVPDLGAVLAAVAAAESALEPETERGDLLSLTDFASFLGTSESSALLQLMDLLPAELSQRVLHLERRTAAVETQLPDLGYPHFAPVFERIEARLAQLAPDHPGFTFHLAGQAVLSGRIYTQFSEDLMRSLVYAALTIFAVLTLAFRSLRLGLISVVPNAFPLLATACILVWIDTPMAGATAFVMSLGIAVDDTIHFMTRFRHEYKQDGELDAALERTVMRVGKALLVTTIVLVVGFASVMTSDFLRNRVFSAMVCTTVLSALVCDMILLPAMIKTFGPGKRLREKWGPGRSTPRPVD